MPFPDSPYGYLTRAQLERLRLAIDSSFVDKKQGTLSYMAQHEVRAELTRIFGYGRWGTKLLRMELLWESGHRPGTDDPDYPKDKSGNEYTNGKTYYRACYLAEVQLSIRDYWGRPVGTFDGVHAEANSVLPDRGEAHAMACTSVESYAMRRAAINLGDRFGLGLYDKGSELPLVRNGLQFTDAESPWYKPKPEGETPPSQSTDRLQGAMNVAEGAS